MRLKPVLDYPTFRRALSQKENRVNQMKKKIGREAEIGVVKLRTASI